VREQAHLRKSDGIAEHRPEKRVETEHVVRCGRDVDEEKGEQIREALENRFPTRPVAEFNLRLTPLSVGAWLLIIVAFGDSDYEILGYDSSELEVTDVLASADVLVARWRVLENGGVHVPGVRRRRSR
jgi:hypothetical protein